MNRRGAIFLGIFALLCARIGSDVPLRGQGKAPKQPPSAPSGAPPASAAQFAYGGDAAEIPAEFVGDTPYLPVRVNDSRPLSFVLDSTATSSSIDPARLGGVGISPQQAPVLSLNGLDMRLGALPAVSRADFGWETGHVYEGALGEDFLRNVVVEIDYARQTVRLFDPATYTYSGEGTPIHLTFAAGLPVIPIRFADPKGKVIGADFVVSTTVDDSLVLFEHYAEGRRILSSHWKKIGNVDPLLTGSGNAVVGRLKEVEVGKSTAQGILATFSSSALPGSDDSHIAGVIGARMLARFTVTFDYPHQQIYLVPNAHFPSDDQEDKSGISVAAKGNNLKTFEVAGVSPGTPGAKAGVQKGDVIAGIDDDAAADLTLAEIRDLFRQIGHKYTLVIDRNGETKKITVEMKRLLDEK